MNKKKIEIIRSSTFFSDDIIDISRILDEAIDGYLTKKDKIINIQVKETDGQSRFWIYVIINGEDENEQQ